MTNRNVKKTNTTDTTIELARWFDIDGKQKTVNIQQYLDYISKQNKLQLAEFIYERLYSRYLKPFEFSNQTYLREYKNGFSIIANCCLLIETLQSFKNGWGDSNSKSKEAFQQFFTSEPNFSQFKGNETGFYVNVRCGILHQGETTGGWTINRGKTRQFDKQNLSLNSVWFLNELKISLKNYSDDLNSSEWEGELWDKFRLKMSQILSNCMRQ